MLLFWFFALGCRCLYHSSMLLHKLWHRNSRLQSWKIKCKKNKVLPCLPYCLLPLNMYIPIFPTTSSNNIQQINHKPFSLFVLLIRQYTLLLELCSLDLGPFVKNRLLIALLMGPFKKVITTMMMTLSWMTVCLKGLNDRCPHSSKSAEFIQINWKLHFPRIWKGKITRPFSNLVPHCFYHIGQFGHKTNYSTEDQQDKSCAP